MKRIFSYPLQKFILLVVAWWGVWVLVQTLVLHRLNVTWQFALVDSVLFNTLLTLACLAAVMIYRYYQPGAGNRLYRLVFAVIITLLFCNVFKWLFELIYPGSEYLTFIESSMPLRFVFSLLILSFVTLLNWMWNNLMDQNVRDKMRAEADQLLKDAELVKLRQQLQPHFLFNSLNSISALAGTKPEEARKMIQQLSDFLRGTLKKDEKQTVTLKEELQHLGLYLDIEKVRFGHRLNIVIDAAPGALEMELPPLILQPIVENAIKFGLYGTTGNIQVSLKAGEENNVLILEVENPFDADTQSGGQGTGFGLSSIRRRLYLLYSRNDLLGTEKKGNTFITKLKVPKIKIKA